MPTTLTAKTKKTESDYGEDELKQIFAAARQVRAICEEFNKLFPGRDFLFKQIELALLMRAHVLVFGTYGAGKSMLIRWLVQQLGVAEDKLYVAELSRFSGKNELFGPPNVKHMRDTGEHRLNTEGTILEAVFADLGEYYDAPQIVRMLNGPLYERFYSAGGDSRKLQLHTAFASTNTSPDTLMQEYPKLDANLDRWLFRSSIGWLDDDELYLQVVNNFCDGRTPTKSLAYDRLLQASRLVADPTDQIPVEFRMGYVKFFHQLRAAWKASGWFLPSDRTGIMWLEVLEANAIINGRYKVHPEDLRALEFAACDGSQEMSEVFHEIADPTISKLSSDLDVMDIDDALKLAMDGIRGSMPDVPSGQVDNGELVGIMQDLQRKKEDAETMEPVLDATRQQVKNLREELDQRIDAVYHMIKHGQP